METRRKAVTKFDHASTHLHLFWILNFNIFWNVDNELLFIK